MPTLTHERSLSPTDPGGSPGSSPVGTMQVSRAPQHPGFEQLGGPNTPGEDYLLLVDGRVIGGTYWCGADYIPDGQRWASWGPAGLSLRHHDRQDAERVQVREYAINPDVVDRAIAADEREAATERARQDVADAERAEQRRRERLGDDQPGPNVWVLPSHHFLFAAEEDVVAVKAWLDAHDLDEVSGLHAIRVEQRAGRRVIVYERAQLWARSTETWVVTCTLDPPPVDTTPRPDLIALLAEHYPAKFPLIDYGAQYACAACTRAFTSPTAVTPWPCAVFTTARDRTPVPDPLPGPLGDLFTTVETGNPA
jgi:hypothetical protein